METVNAIREFVTRELLQTDGINLKEDTPLIQEGYLTSLQTVELVLFLEKRFRVEIDPEDVTEENFRSLADIAAFVQEKQGRAA